MSGITIEGLGKINEVLESLKTNTDKHIRSAYIVGGKLVESTAKQSIQHQSFGTHVTRYREGGASYSHIAAKPGGAPNTDTGRLVSSINTEIEENWVVVGTSLPYGEWLEFGTKKMEARPWLLPALDKNNDMIIELHRKALNKSIKEIGNLGLTK